ncbi:small acidic protein 1 [Dorcoceras hygrometricum]|uniref:Small acidic protein 1 n=1 Tax=Dorcoceras hygrometricum TaxID=472368 RepID=A0A2Z7BI56_9LAMI|nr:small acidic protein 1 [Dorcoceras hygrometricum]
MKTLAMDYFGEMEDQSGGVTVAMDVDDVDSSLDLFGEGPIALDLHRLADADFFNSFEDDFDDEDIN